MIFRTTHSPWPPPPYFMQILMKPQQKEDVQSWCKSKEALWVVRFRDLDKKRGVGVLREWPGAQPGKQVEVSLGHQTGWCVLTAESCPESWLGVDWGRGCARPAEWEWSDLSGCSLLFFYPFLFPHPSSHIPAPRDWAKFGERTLSKALPSLGLWVHPARAFVRPVAGRTGEIKFKDISLISIFSHTYNRQFNS